MIERQSDLWVCEPNLLYSRYWSNFSNIETSFILPIVLMCWTALSLRSDAFWRNWSWLMLEQHKTMQIDSSARLGSITQTFNSSTIPTSPCLQKHRYFNSSKIIPFGHSKLSFAYLSQKLDVDLLFAEFFPVLSANIFFSF